MAAIVQGLERQIVVLDVVGSIPTSRPILRAGGGVFNPAGSFQISLFSY